MSNLSSYPIVSNELNKIFHLINKLHPYPVADRLAQEHGNGDDPNVGTEKAQGDRDKVAYTGQEDEKGHPGSFVLDPVLNLL